MLRRAFIMWYICDVYKFMFLYSIQCHDDDFHVKIGSKEYFEILFDGNKFKELDADMKSGDPLNFVDTKPYKGRIAATIQKTELNDAVRTAVGKMNDLDIVVACMDFNFIGGSMGSVVGEKIARAIDHSLKNKIPFLMISKSGGARMMEAGFSLMQMAKTSAVLARMRRRVGPDLPIIGVGGVSSAETALEKIRAGADLVQLYSCMVYEGPALPGRIVKGLSSLLDRETVANIRELRDTRLDHWLSVKV